MDIFQLLIMYILTPVFTVTAILQWSELDGVLCP